MRAWLILLLLAPLAAAHGDEHESVAQEYVLEGTGTIDSIAFSVDDQTIHVHAITDEWIDVFVMIGEPGEPEPDEWYLLHLGNSSMVVDASGAVQDSNGTIARTGGAGGECVVLAAQTWHRVDSEKQVLDTVPADLTALEDAWGTGDRCHDDATAPAAETKDSPVGFIVATIALIAAVTMRRR